MGNNQVDYFDIPNFIFQDGTNVPNVRLAYQVINPSASKVALIPTCFRGRINSTLTFSHGALHDHRIIVVALFGNGESSSPSNTPAFAGSIDYCDCVRAQYQLLQHLGIPAIDAIVGFSMGGQCAYHWIVMFPDFVKNAVIICSSARTSLHNYQFLEGPKAALENSVDYVDGTYRTQGVQPRRGLRAFGKAYSAWLTSAAWFEEQLFRTMGYSSLQEWDAAVTDKNYEGWDAEDLLTMLRMWQHSDVSSCRGDGSSSIRDTLASIKARVLLMPCETDQYFDWRASEKERDMIPDATLQVIPSVWGHLAGAGSNKEDSDWMDGVIDRFLRESIYV
jgi:homoserine O-acetyltransferase